jgi:hypothetical protein
MRFTGRQSVGRAKRLWIVQSQGIKKKKLTQGTGELGGLR